jgi:hypothetical protein
MDLRLRKFLLCASVALWFKKSPLFLNWSVKLDDLPVFHDMCFYGIGCLDLQSHEILSGDDMTKYSSSSFLTL